MQAPIARGVPHHAGFTTIELLVAITVLAVLLAIGVPSLTGLMRQWQRDAAVNTLAGDVRHARSVATRVSRAVVMCAQDGRGACSRRNDWAPGWLTFVDFNGNGRFDTGDSLIVQREAPTGLDSITSNLPFPHNIVLRSNGTISGLSFTFTVKARGTADADARQVVTNNMGRTYVQAPVH